MSAALDKLAASTAAIALPAWAQALRERDRERFEQNGLPHKRLEDWKYTPLTGLADLTDPAGLSDPRAEGPGHPLEGLPDAVPTIRMIDGVMADHAESAPETHGLHNLPGGVTATSLAVALEADGADAVRELLEGLASEAPSLAMSALNTATLGQGLVLRVASGVDAGTVMLDWRSAEVQDGTARVANARLLVLLEEGAKLDLVEHYAVAGVTNIVLQGRLAAGSRFHHARLQDNPPGSWLITRSELEQHADAVSEQASLDLGAGLARHDLRARLAAPGAVCTALGAYLPDGEAHVDHHLDVRHEAPGCHSEQTFRGVLHGRGRAVFNGRVHVLPGADDSEAHQSNQNLLLSREAEVNTKPELIIEADEVVASHGATVGQLDEGAVFYLRSRGIAERLARRMLTGAFCRSVVEAMTNDAARDAFRGRLEQALEAAS